MEQRFPFFRAIFYNPIPLSPALPALITFPTSSSTTTVPYKSTFSTASTGVWLVPPPLLPARKSLRISALRQLIPEWILWRTEPFPTQLRQNRHANLAAPIMTITSFIAKSSSFFDFYYPAIVISFFLIETLSVSCGIHKFI